MSVEPLPSTKIDIAQMYIRSEIRNIMSTGKKTDLEMPWNKEKQIRLKDLPIEEQAKRAIGRIKAQCLGVERTQRCIKAINEKLERMKKAQQKDG
jgi:hypothetical protein